MKLTVSHVRIPMRYRFGHARTDRSVADNVIVEAELADGTRGYGECVPREYVTGESIASVMTTLGRVTFAEHADLKEAAGELSQRDLAAELGSIADRPQLAAACALELAILDAHARREQRSLFDAILGTRFSPLLHDTPPTHVRQTLTIGDDLDGALDRAGSLACDLDLKVKLGFGSSTDRSRVARLHAAFPEADLRGDANGVFHLENARVLLRTLGRELTAIEEPLADRDLSGCAVMRKDGTKVMLDESLCTVKDGERALEAGAVDFFNLRLSKCGGLFGTLRLVELAERAGLGWQLGCMVGETGILSSLGRGFFARVRGARWFESTVPGRSLAADLTTAHLDHTTGTRMTPVPTDIGFGAPVRRDVLDTYTIERVRVG